MPALDIGEQNPAPEEMFGNDTSKFPGLPGMSTDSTGEQVYLTDKEIVLHNPVPPKAGARSAVRASNNLACIPTLVLSKLTTDNHKNALVHASR